MKWEEERGSKSDLDCWTVLIIVLSLNRFEPGMMVMCVHGVEDCGGIRTEFEGEPSLLLSLGEGAVGNRFIQILTHLPLHTVVLRGLANKHMLLCGNSGVLFAFYGLLYCKCWVLVYGLRVRKG